MKKSFIFSVSCLVLMLMVVGCSQKATPSTSLSVDDSTHIEYFERQVEVKLPGDSIWVTKWIECDSAKNLPKPFTMKSKSTRETVRVDLSSKGLLTVTCTEDSLKQVIKAMDKYIYRLRHEDRTKTLPPQYITRKIDIICRWIAGIVALLIIVFIGSKFLKFKPF